MSAERVLSRALLLLFSLLWLDIQLGHPEDTFVHLSLPLPRHVRPHFVNGEVVVASLSLFLSLSLVPVPGNKRGAFDP